VTIGICVYDMAPDEVVDLAIAADELGFDALWIGEHVVAPLGHLSEHPTTGSADHVQLSKPIVDPAVRLVDPWVVLGAVATRTTRLRLGTAVYVLPLRHPMLTARAGASLAQLSGGRFRLGIGVGWLEEEFDALGMPFRERGRRADETLEILRRAWAGGGFSHHGDAWDLEPVQVVEQPVEVPIVIGGNSRPAFRRACRFGDAWFASGTPSFDEAARLHEEFREVERDLAPGRQLPVYVRMSEVRPELVEKYQAEGIEHLVIWGHEVWTGATTAEKHRSLERTAAEFGLG
jgi:probable F420-dependent oxidoreductase